MTGRDRAWRVVVGVAAVAAAACGRDGAGNGAATAATDSAHAASGRNVDATTAGAAASAAAAQPNGGMVAGPDGMKPGEWTLPGRDYAGTRYSPLNTITPANVKNLKVAWTFSTGLARGFEGQPLVVNNTMYVVTPYPNYVFALDLTKPEGPVKWAYKPVTDPASQGEACCDVVNRGASYAAGKIVINRLDNHTVALDANTGKVLWDTKLGEVSRGETMTMAPLIVRDKVFVGNAGGELGVRGWITALDLNTGKVAWKAFNTGPDADVKIGPRFQPFYPQFRGKDLGVKTWPAEQWKLGGGTVWGWVTYDPETNLIYYGTSNPGVWNPDLRPGDNLWSTTLFARDPDTGEARWAWQATPHDEWDYDDVNESIPVNLAVNGQTRKVMVHFDRNGFGTTIDRATGEVLVAQPFQYLNWAKSMDLKTGRPVLDPTKETHQGVNTKNICPSSTGARDQQPAGYSPRTGLFYSPSTNLCMDYAGIEASYIAGTPYLGADVQMFAGPGGDTQRGGFFAWDAAHGKKVWNVTERFPVWSGALVTAGDVVFYGTMDGWFKARDARTGQELWKFKTGSGIIGNAITYTGPDGKQYVAIYAGIGGWAGAIALGLATDDPTGALGALGAMTDLPKYTAPGGMVYVFSL